MICYNESVDLPESLHITDQLKLKGDLTSAQSVHLSTQYLGKIKTKRQLLCDPKAILQGGIRSETLKIESGSKVNAEVQVGTRIPLWLKIPFTFLNFSSSDE